jgi:glucans biosynthesis protein
MFDPVRLAHPSTPVPGQYTVLLLAALGCSSVAPLSCAATAPAGCANVAHCPENPAAPAAEASARDAARVASVQPSRHGAALEPPPVYFAAVVERARSLVARPPREPKRVEMPSVLRNIQYDAYRSIRFRPERSLWHDGPGQFEVQFFHPGFYYQDVVDVSVLGPAGPEPVPFSTELFSYDKVAAPPRDAALAFTGFRLHAPLNSETYKDELVVFQGASYFRPLGKGNVYGLSARGLAIDLGQPTPEEFPRFSEFFLVPPKAGEAHVWVLALLESRRATGAYAFRIEKGILTSFEVTAELFMRESVALGIAPLTSMYLFGEEGPNRFGDFRPEVHDSDGLALWAESGEWIYRPLRNPSRTTVCSFRLDHPRGFGLVQRDRNFANFQDLEARYQDRPSVWVEPIAGFEQGSVRLLEIATELETDDNIAIAFVPAGEGERQHSVRYRLHVGAGVPVSPTAAQVTATRIARTKRGARFLVDFSGNGLGSQQDVDGVVSVQNGRILEQHVEHNPFADGYRASFEVEPEPGTKDVELRGFLRAKGDALTETWSYLWQPNR